MTHLRVQLLEDRVTPAYSATFSGFTSTWTGNSSGVVGDILSFSRDSGTGNLIHNRFIAGDAGFNSAQDFDSTVAGDQVLAASAASDVRITTGASSAEQVRIGGSVGGQTAAASQLLALFIVTAGGTGQTVLVDDSTATTGRTFTYASNGVTTTGVGVSFAGSGFGGGISLRTGTGNDTVNLTGVLGIGIGSEPRTVINTGGNDTVTIGSSGGSLDGFAGQPITVTGNAGTTAVMVNDSGDAGSDTYRIASADVQREDGTNDVDISFSGVGVSVSLNTGGGDDAIEFANGATLNGGTIDGGTGTDTINYSAFTSPVAVNLGLGVTGLTATLDGGQENPGVGTAAAGTAALTNYSVTNRTFDLVVTVTGLAPADVTGFHFHRGGVGVNGPVVFDLLGLAPLTPTADGFTFTLTGVALSAFTGGVANEAALLGGQLYLNVHTAAAPSGLIRGQVFSTGNVNLGTGTATGTGGVSNVENATGGSAADSLVGSFAANVLTGNGGNDTLLGGPGADTFVGGADDDVMIWSNGDGSDVMDGGAGTDTVAVNGNLTGNDTFTIGAGAGGRVAFARTSAGPFTLDIGTTETMQVNGVGGNDTFTVSDLTGVAGLTAVGLNGLAGNDTFTVIPFTGTTTVRGGLGSDTLSVTTAGTTNPFVTLGEDVAGGRSGGFTFGNRGAVNFNQTETAGTGNFVTVTKTDGQTTATAGGSIVYTLTVTNTSALGVNGITVTDALPAALTNATWTAVFSSGTSGTSAGTGNINQTVNLAAGGSVTYTITATIDSTFTGTLTNTATAAVPAGLTDTTADDDSATDTTTVALPPPVPPVVPPVPPVVPPVPPVVPPVPPSSGSFTDLYTAASGAGVPVVVDVFNADGTKRFTLTPFGSFGGGSSVATGDLTGDGIDDIAVGARAGGGPHVKVFDGRTGAEVWSFFAYDEPFRGGVNVALGDVDGDGYADLLTGAGPGGGPHVKVFDGRTGGERFGFFAYAEAFRGGVNVAMADVDGDRQAELITGAWAGGGPHVKMFNSDGSERFGFFAFDATFSGGVTVAAGDLNGDGRDELIVGQASKGGRVSTFNGQTAARLTEVDAFPGFGGGANVAASDLNADATDEVLVAAGPGGGPHVRVLSSALQEQASFFAFDPAFLGGVFIG